MPQVVPSDLRCAQKWEDLTVLETGFYCGGCGRPVVHFGGAGKTDVTRALLLYPQSPCITISQADAGNFTRTATGFEP